MALKCKSKHPHLSTCNYGSKKVEETTLQTVLQMLALLKTL